MDGTLATATPGGPGLPSWLCRTFRGGAWSRRPSPPCYRFPSRAMSG